VYVDREDPMISGFGMACLPRFERLAEHLLFDQCGNGKFLLGVMRHLARERDWSQFKNISYMFLMKQI